ncbi:Helicase, superfamily 1/2, ATP-binding domain-containing protein [Cynara cardunculus var. scolymus]|uniref:Helicase, superfamily 1/2, ATP-binding domain-containing protein n=1 Tax=Cynara cardunculus var. scolymus TaxID=59895 RepID=A0A103Y6G6_CYNCS|nr:Helicase, superfamily 1/2, ATP-binding domain-containing protein [Cynara cardunculus var. scolymus]
MKTEGGGDSPVVNTRAIQVGHIEKKVASVLAPLIDSNLVHVEGIVPNTPKNSVRTSESMVVKEKKKSDVDEVFKLVDENVSKSTVTGTMEPPKDVILPDLFLHQKEGLSWLHHRENSDELPPFWEERDDGFINALTNYQTDKRPEPLRGGIFADDMGLGKTLTLLSLIALDKCKISNDGTSELMGIEDDQSVVQIGKKSRTRTVNCSKKQKTDDTLLDERKKKERIGTKMTLIVCPPSVFSTWITQLTDHTKRGRLKAYMYYGERTQDVSELQNYDIILTTYSTLASELNNSNAPIKKIDDCDCIQTELADASNNPKLLQKLVLMLQDGEDFDCPICLAPPTQIVITSCAHFFCRTCIIGALNHSISVCPLCRCQLSESDIFSPPPEYATEPNQAGSSSSCQPSSKVAALLKLLEASRNENPSIKSVIFSQFRKLLLLLEEPLKAAGFKTLRFKRAATLEDG